MSTVLLMTDSWQPTVLRLVPFSQNNAKNTEKKGSGRNNGSRGFPVLAVTRTDKTINTVQAKTPTSCHSAGSSRSENLTEPDTAKSEISVATAAGSSYTNFTSTTNRTDDRQSIKRDNNKRYQKKIVPKSHADLNEAITFPVQDLNEQISSSSSFKSLESANETKTNNPNKLDNTRTKLPKPSLCPSPDVKMCSPINGVRRSVPLTPGELELKRFRESYILEQAQKRKKYKLNVNQLPRSTTPINDHDPDKLNMKQVIAFLQTKATRDTQKKVKDANCHKNTHHRNAKSNTKECARIALRSSNTSRTNDSLPGRSQTSVSFADKNTPGRVSVLSTKSTPNFSSIKRADGSHTVKSISRRADKVRKPMKEFKLYRFLTVAPDGQTQGLATAVTDAVPTSDATGPMVSKLNKQTEKKEFLRRSYRATTTANLLHRRAARKTTVTPTSGDEKENESSRGTAIRLPSVTHDHDYHDEGRHSSEEEDETDSCSTTSATYNSTKNSSYKEDRSKYPKKGKTLTFREDKEEAVSECPHTKHDENSVIDHESQLTLNNTSFTTRVFMNPDLPRVNINGPRQIRVSLPQESRNGYSQEIVRLTLRHEKNATRVTSYMSDMQTEKWPLRMEADLEDGANQFTALRPMNSTLNYSSHKALYESPKQIMNSVSNNHFIKVREKLKSNYENELT